MRRFVCRRHIRTETLITWMTSLDVFSWRCCFSWRCSSDRLLKPWMPGWLSILQQGSALPAPWHGAEIRSGIGGGNCGNREPVDRSWNFPAFHVWIWPRHAVEPLCLLITVKQNESSFFLKTFSMKGLLGLGRFWTKVSITSTDSVGQFSADSARSIPRIVKPSIAGATPTCRFRDQIMATLL